MFLDCPAYLDEDGTTRCGLPAEVTARYTTGSTSGPLDNMRICCPSGHRFNGPVEFLTWPADRGPEQATASAHPMTPAPTARRSSDSPIRR
jgi:hypothetical protein